MSDPLDFGPVPTDPPRRMTRDQMLGEAVDAVQRAVVDVEDALAWLLRVEQTPQRPTPDDDDGGRQMTRRARVDGLLQNVRLARQHLTAVLEGNTDGD